jgi:hypothetical protein
MTVIHCTRKLAGKIPGVSASALEEAGGLGGWHANLVRWHREVFCASLATEGIADAVIARVEAALGPARLAA